MVEAGGADATDASAVDGAEASPFGCFETTCSIRSLAHPIWYKPRTRKFGGSHVLV